MAYNYWEERFKRLKTTEMRKAERANADLARVYRETLRQLRAEVEQWYDRFAKENNISLAEARRILDNRELKEFKMTLADFIKEAKRLDLDPAHIRMLENASMRVRLTRSQEIYLKTAQYVEKLAKSQGWQLNGLMREVYTDSVYKTAYETQKVTGFENFRAVRERQIEEAISKPWAPDGADFSSRIWKNKTQLINSLQTDITQSLMTGTSTAQLSEKIAARFNTSYNQAYRLVETETAYIQERAMLDTYDELGLEQYQICAVLDSKTSEICQDLDGKVFDRKDAKPGITMPPFHCHCRSTTVPYIEGLLDDGGRVARDPETGKTVEIPDMTYKEWKEKYVKPEAEYLKAEQAKVRRPTRKEPQKMTALVSPLRFKVAGVWKFIPRKTLIEEKRVIAGGNTGRVLHAADRLSAKYHVDKKGWEKVVGVIVSEKFIFDIHWYRHLRFGNIEYKIKNKKERRKNEN
ncbi:MAG: minor capsid protein [Negativicoccus succinicivorans]|uniref:minor capsid protein n=1 Tax=Negativicoccus succinicivorans TaxID=620903 RepID=UPI00290CB63A|nr:minor capsid protein [Negativicoccus succinicivorans]MDU5914492.1 minor capsid protein [Negativicoccus succinicivorans]